MFSATLRPECLTWVMAVPPTSTRPTGSRPTSAVLHPFQWPNGYSPASTIHWFLFLFFSFCLNRVVEMQYTYYTLPPSQNIFCPKSKYLDHLG